MSREWCVRKWRKIPGLPKRTPDVEAAAARITDPHVCPGNSSRGIRDDFGDDYTGQFAIPGEVSISNRAGERSKR